MNLINKGSSIVVDAEDRIKGIFTERDFIKKVVEQNKYVQKLVFLLKVMVR